MLNKIKQKIISKKFPEILITFDTNLIKKIKLFGMLKIKIEIKFDIFWFF